MDLILAAIFGYSLFRQARLKGIPATPYILNFGGAFILIEVLVAYTMVSIYGKDFIQNEEARKTFLYLSPVVILLQTLLFFFFRNKIKKARVWNDEDDLPPSPPQPPKKDLSYFR